MTSRKPSFYARLSSLILIQVIFVFSAVVLVIFYPDNPEETGEHIELLQEQFAASCRSFESDYLVSERSSVSDTTLMAGLTRIIRENLSVGAVGLLALSPIDSMAMDLYVGRGDRAVEVLRVIIEQAGVSHDKSLAHHVIDQPVGLVVSGVIDQEFFTSYYNLGQADGRSYMIVSVAEHGLLISSKSNLGYIVFLLFLVSSLISLLTVYLISVRVKRPLARLLHGIERTAKGEAYHIIGEDKDGEINGLISSFNSMAEILIENQRRLREYNARSTEMTLNLMKSHLFLATMVDSSPYPIIATSSSGEILLAGKKAIDMFGYSDGELVGQNMRQLLVLPADCTHLTHRQATEVPGFEARCCRKDGSSFPSYIIAAPIGVSETDAEAWLYIVRDISDSEQFQEMMIRLDRYTTRGEMAGDIAHDINNFLAILSGNIELMPIILRKGDDEKITRKLTLMKETVDKIAHFADGLMDSPQDKVSLVPSDLNQLVETVLAFLKPQKRLRGITISVDLSPELPLVPLDRGQVQQMMTNLIFNAADALADVEGDKQISLATELIKEAEGRFAQIEIADNGGGVDEGNIEHLFEKRFTTRRKGHGIGLVTCRSITEAHHGQISYKFDGGAHFYCKLPIEPVGFLESTDEFTVATEAQTPTS